MGVPVPSRLGGLSAWSQGLTGEQVVVWQLFLDDVIGHHLTTVDNGIPRDVGQNSCQEGGGADKCEIEEADPLAARPMSAVWGYGASFSGLGAHPRRADTILSFPMLKI